MIPSGTSPDTHIFTIFITLLGLSAETADRLLSSIPRQCPCTGFSYPFYPRLPYPHSTEELADALALGLVLYALSEEVNS